MWLIAAAHAETTHDAATWTSALAQVDLHEGQDHGPRLLADVHARRTGPAFTAIVRPAFGWDLNKSLSVALGGAWVGVGGASTDGELVSEARVWEQVMLAGKVEDLQLGLRLRLEQRFLEAGTGHRLRVWGRAAVPVSEALSFVVTDEAFVGTLGPGAPVAFDQNRLFVGLALPLYEKSRIEVGYGHVVLTRADATSHFHVVATNLFLSR